MNNLQNLHTHTIYCDGKDTIEEMILKAREKNFQSIGFSGHSPMGFPTTYAMKWEEMEDYKQEINFLSGKYAEKINIFCGIEADMYSCIDLNGYDYTIGSVHYIKFKDELIDFDRTEKDVRKIINTYFNGDGMSYAKAYYRELAKLSQYGNYDIIGHFDIITKHAEKVKFFDTDSKEYRTAAIEAAEALAGEIPYFEVNTGAIARGYRTTPYPDPFIIKELRRLGFGAVITSDCHDSGYLDCAFEHAADLLKTCGFEERYILTEAGFVPIKL